jgi:hypothetical protein
MDENLGHGLYTTLIRFGGGEVKVVRGPTFKPPNAALLRRIAAQLQSAADAGATAELRALIERAYEELGGELYAAPDRLHELKRGIGARERRLNEEWRNRVVSWVRSVVRANADARRGAGGRGDRGDRAKRHTEEGVRET